MTRLPDKIDTFLDEIKVTKGGDSTLINPLVVGSTDNSTRFIQRNNIFLDADATQVLINAPERVYFNLTTSANTDFAVEMSGNFPLRIQSQVLNEATCELLWPSYDSYMTNNSVLRKGYVDNTYLKFSSLKPNGGVVLESNALAVDLGASSITGTLGTIDGGTGLTSFTPNSFLLAPTSSTLNTSKAVPGGFVIGSNDVQTMSNKSLVDLSTLIINSIDDSKIFKLDCSTIPTATTRVVQANPSAGRMVVSTTGESVNFDNNLGGDTTINLNGGLGNITGDQLTFVGTSGYPFFATTSWTNLTLVTGAISFENFGAPLVVTGNAAYSLVPFVGVLQPGSFQVTTNSLGRLTNTDGLTWTMLVNFSCSLTGGNGSEWEVALFINGIKVSNSYVTTIASNGRYASLSGVWYQSLNGSSVGGVQAPNQYAEIYIKRNVGAGDVTIGSAFLSVLAVRLLPRPV